MTHHSRTFTSEEAENTAKIIGLDFSKAEFEIEELRKGMNVELEHGSHDPATDVTKGTDDPILIAKIAWAHLKEFPDYYQRLEKMEAEAERYWELANENIVVSN